MQSNSSKVWNFCFAKKKSLIFVAVFYVIAIIALINVRMEMSTLIGNSKVYLKVAMIVKSWNSEMNTTKEFSFRERKKMCSSKIIDIHREHVQFGHTGDVGDEHYENVYHPDGDTANTTIAIGGGITSKGAVKLIEQNITNFMIFTTLLPSFCSTVSPGYSFQFYFAYDKADPVFVNLTHLQAFQDAFHSTLEQLCPKNIKTGIHLVECSHSGKPTWAQNDAMLEAYLDNVDYFYRMNDDTKLHTKGWVEEFIKTLKSYDPPNVGVVGPNHSGGNTGILTYDFVHRTHVDIFGFYYPRVFTDWWGDDWVTRVYDHRRTTKLKHIRLAHTMKLGKRYKTDYSVGGRLGGQLNRDRSTLQRYLEHRNNTKKKKVPTATLR